MTAGSLDLVPVELTVYTDAVVVRGRAALPTRPLALSLAAMPDGILELEDATLEEHGSRTRPVVAPVAHIRTESIVIALSDPVLPQDPANDRPSLLLAAPPFAVAGHLLVLSPDDALRDAMRTLPRTGFLSVGSAVYWSEPLGEARRRAAAVAVNAGRIQVVLPYREADPWAGLDQPRAVEPGLALGEARAIDAGLAEAQGMTPGDEA